MRVEISKDLAYNQFMITEVWSDNDIERAAGIFTEELTRVGPLAAYMGINGVGGSFPGRLSVTIFINHNRWDNSSFDTRVAFIIAATRAEMDLRKGRNSILGRVIELPYKLSPYKPPQTLGEFHTGRLFYGSSKIREITTLEEAINDVINPAKDQKIYPSSQE